MTMEGSGIVSSSMILAVVAAVLVIGGIVAAIIAASKSKKTLPVDGERSYFDGGFFAYLGINLLANFVTTITLGIAFPWMTCWRYRWQMRHTVVSGKRLCFDGRGVQLIGRYLLWLFLTVITLGIYGLWMGVAIKKWQVKHTHIQDEDDNSYFDGGVGGYLGIHLLAWLLTIFTLFIGKAWADKMIIAWETRHTVVSSRRHVFAGSGGSLFAKYLLWGLLTLATFGIFSLFLPVKLIRWQAMRTIDHEHTPEAQEVEKMRQEEMRQAALAYRTYTMEDETELLRAGITETMEQEGVKKLAERGLRCAQHEYVRRYGREELTREPYASMLTSSAQAGFTPAMYDYSLSPLCTDPALGEQMLLTAAGRGYVPAMQARFRSLISNISALNLPQLRESLRWYELLKSAGILMSPEEEQAVENCRRAIRRIESGKGGKGGGSVVGIVFAALGAVVLLAVGAAFVLGFLRAKTDARPAHTEMYSFVEGSGTANDPYCIEEWRDFPSLIRNLGYDFPEDAYFRLYNSVELSCEKDIWTDVGFGGDWPWELEEEMSMDAWLERLNSGHLDLNGNFFTYDGVSYHNIRPTEEDKDLYDWLCRDLWYYVSYMADDGYMFQTDVLVFDGVSFAHNIWNYEAIYDDRGDFTVRGVYYTEVNHAQMAYYEPLHLDFNENEIVVCDENESYLLTVRYVSEDVAEIYFPDSGEWVTISRNTTLPGFFADYFGVDERELMAANPAPSSSIPELDEETAWELASLPYVPYYYFRAYVGLDESRSYEMPIFEGTDSVTCYAAVGCSTKADLREKLLRHMTEEQAWRYLPDDATEWVTEVDGVCYLIPNYAMGMPMLLRETMSIGMAEEGVYYVSAEWEVGGRSDFWLVYDAEDDWYKLSDIINH